jgi:dolichol-phosphate mannosyltransferase
MEREGLDIDAGADTLSVVIPVWNERPSLAPLFEELVPVLRGLRDAGRRFEILAIDDGSHDGSPDELERLADIHPELRVLRRTHRGKSEALFVGFEAARGSWVVTLDADLQDDPAEIPRLLALADGNTLVIGIRDRADSGWRKLVSRVANAARRAVLRDGLVDIGCPLRVLPRAQLEGLPRFEGLHRFLPALLEARGVAVVQVPVAHRTRRYGSSKYGTASRFGRGLVHLAQMRSWTRQNRGALRKAE